MRASTRGDTRRVERRLISSGGKYEPIMGYSRAVVAGGHVYVSGTAPGMPDDADPPADAYGQAQRCFEIILAALDQAGARAEDVVRTRVYVTSAEVFPEVARAHSEIFGEIRPVNTTVIAQLMDPRWHVEIDVEAVLP
jgi:enamine deaminase RidA (YjgF/YER057c/UK114 family)